MTDDLERRTLTLEDRARRELDNAEQALARERYERDARDERIRELRAEVKQLRSVVYLYDRARKRP